MSRSVSVLLPAPGIARDADDEGAPGVREELLQELEVAGDAIVDVAHRARGGTRVTRDDAVAEVAT